MKAYMHSFVCIYRKIDIVFYIQSFIYICSCTLGCLMYFRTPFHFNSCVVNGASVCCEFHCLNNGYYCKVGSRSQSYSYASLKLPKLSTSIHTSIYIYFIVNFLSQHSAQLGFWFFCLFCLFFFVTWVSLFRWTF